MIASVEPKASTILSRGMNPLFGPSLMHKPCIDSLVVSMKEYSEMISLNDLGLLKFFYPIVAVDPM